MTSQQLFWKHPYLPDPVEFKHQFVKFKAGLGEGMDLHDAHIFSLGLPFWGLAPFCCEPICEIIWKLGLNFTGWTMNMFKLVPFAFTYLRSYYIFFDSSIDIMLIPHYQAKKIGRKWNLCYAHPDDGKWWEQSGLWTSQLKNLDFILRCWNGLFGGKTRIWSIKILLSIPFIKFNLQFKAVTIKHREYYEYVIFKDRSKMFGSEVSIPACATVQEQ